MGRPSSVASWLRLYWVLAMQIGQVAEAHRLVEREALGGRGQEVDAVGAVDPGGDRLDLVAQWHLVGVEQPEVGAALLGRGPDRVRELLGARAAVDEVARTDSVPAPAASATSRIAAISSAVSVGKRLMATTAGTPNARTFSICLARFAPPRRTASGLFSSRAGSSGLPATILPTPPCILSARTVATTTAASGSARRRGT